MPRKSQYMYETTPKKLDYKSPKSKRDSKSRNNSSKTVPKRPTQTKATIRGKAEVATNAGQETTKKMSKPKAIVYLVIAFSLLFMIGYRNTIIDQNFAQLQKSKNELVLLEKQNQQAKIQIENSLNLENIEKIASEKLGMRKLSASQKIYLTLPKRDYIEPASEKVVIEDDTWFTQVVKMLRNLL